MLPKILTLAKAATVWGGVNEDRVPESRHHALVYFSMDDYPGFALDLEDVV